MLYQILESFFGSSIGKSFPGEAGNALLGDVLLRNALLGDVLSGNALLGYIFVWATPFEALSRLNLFRMSIKLTNPCSVTSLLFSSRVSAKL